MATPKTALTLAVLLCICTGMLDAARPLPSFMKPCPKNDPKLNECAASSGNVAIPKLKNGIPSFGVPPLDPFFVKKIDVEGANLGIRLYLRDVNLQGLTNTKIESIRIILDPPNFRFNFKIPVIQMAGQYEASGKAFLLPISGEGDFNFTIVGMDVQYEVNCDTVKKSDGESYYVPKENTLDYSVEHAQFQMDNLFNGNKLLGDEMNRFLNENWKEVAQTAGPKVAESVAAAVQSVIAALASKVPVKNFWTEK